MSDKINTQADFDHAHQLLTAKTDKALDELKAFAIEQGIPTGFIITSETPNMLSKRETSEGRQMEMIQSIISNVPNPTSDLLEAALRLLKNELITIPKESNDAIGSIMKAAEIAALNDLNLMAKLHTLLSTAELLNSDLEGFAEGDSGDSPEAKAVVKAAVNNMLNSGKAH